LKNPAKLIKKSNIFLLEPYDPNKIPVLLVHGLYSNPGTYLDMYNDLTGIPGIRERCQFWFFFYPTGIPIAESSSILRKKLKELHDRLDPKSGNMIFNNMVVVGHSMGGLLSKMLIQDSGDKFFNAVFKVSVDSPDFSPAERMILKEKMFFRHFPSIKRTVFIATPHRGSDIAIAWWARILSKTISLPASFVNASTSVLLNKKHLMREMPPEYQDVIPTSVQALSPNNPAIKALCDIPFCKDVRYHSIIGIRDADKGPGSSDGIVPYSSSHLDGAVSEYLVHDSHTCVSNPDVIAEVKRLVLLHLKEIDDQRTAAKEKEVDSSSAFVKFSKVMSELSKNKEFIDTLMARIGRNPNAGGLIGPQEIQIIKQIIFFRDFAAFDRFPGLTVRGMGISVALAGEKAKRRKAENPEPEKQPASNVLTENVIEDLGLPAPKDEKQPASDSLLKTLGYGLQVGDKIDPSKTKIVSDSRRMASMLNRLSLNPTEKDKPKYMVKLGDKLIDSPDMLVDELMKSGSKIEVKDARYFANFGDLFYKGMEVLTAYWLNTEIPVPGTDSSLLVPVSHSQHELRIDGADFSIELSFYFGIDGKVEFRIIDTLDQSWVLGRVAKVYSGKDAVEVVRLEGEIIKTYEKIKKANPDLPFGGYYALGVCDDVNAAIEYHMSGETTLFPLPHDVKYFQGDSEVEKIVRKLPADGRGDAMPDPMRVLGSIPADDFSRIPMPGLREQLKKVKEAYANGMPVSQGK
jgi:pimeloyl-ACP methyl ester carboxylesterase